MRCIPHGLKIKTLNKKRKSKMKPNKEMQAIPSCENCTHVKELLNEIVRLKEHVTWLNYEIVDLEKEIASLDDKLTSIYPNLSLKKSS